MNQLTVINQNGQLLVDSRDVAEMIEREHKHLLRDIRSFMEILGKSNFGLADFFIENYYNDTQGKPRPHFFLTKKGCDMVANKMTGEKGVLFTAVYVTQFEQMEYQLKQPKSQLEILQASINQLVDQEKRLSHVETRLAETEKKQVNITEILSLHPTEWRKKVSSLLNKIAQQRGGHQAYSEVRTESYQLLEERAKCQLSIRLKNKKGKNSLEGMPKSNLDKLNKMDVIADDARLTEIYLSVVKEMAIKHQVQVD